jgi:hypothetical protein
VEIQGHASERGAFMNRLWTAFNYLNRTDDDPEAWVLVTAATVSGRFLRIPHTYVTPHPKVEIVRLSWETCRNEA